MKTTHRVFMVLAVGFAVGLLTTATALADSDEKYRKMPGYVDFGELGVFGQIEPSVEVLLKGPLLKLAQEAVKKDEPALASALESVKLVRVNVFPLEGKQAKDLSKNVKKLAANLEKKGWEMAVRVREKDEDVYIYLLPGKEDHIDGLVVMVIEHDAEATFVNIVGPMDPAQIGRIGGAIHINGLDIPDLGSYHNDDEDE
jgi:hypothetical protein